MIRVRDCLSRDWVRLIGTGPIGIGGDLATTEKEKSNPSSIVVTEKVGPLYVERLVLRWKTSREEVSTAMFDMVFSDLVSRNLRPRRMSIDATNERFFAQTLQRRFRKHCPVDLIVASENVPHIKIDGEAVNWKEYCGWLYTNSYTDALMRTPNARWLLDDRRLVKKDKGRFVAATGPDGSHADTFDGGKLARLSLEGKGRAEIASVPVGGISGAKPLAQGLRNPLLIKAHQQASRRISC